MQATDVAISRNHSANRSDASAVPQPAPPAAEPPSRFDRSVLDETLAFLRPNEVVDNLQSLGARTRQVMQMLEQPGSPPLLADAAHTLASIAGMFGFVALSAAARSFEAATPLTGYETESLSRRLYTEAHASLHTLDSLLAEIGMQSA